MDKQAKLTVLKNAFANVVRGGTIALTAIVVPPFLTRAMSSEKYGAWALLLQISAYIAYLDFGLQTAVGRFVAHTNERGDSDERDRVVSTSVALLAASGALGLIGSLVVSGLLPDIFPRIPSNLLSDIRLGFLLVTASLAIGLPATAINGIFVGLQRNEVPAAFTGGSKVLGAILIVLVARRGGSLSQMGAAMAAVNTAFFLLEYLIYRRLAPEIRISSRLVSMATVRKLYDYCLSLTLWSVAAVLVGGLNITLVGMLEFPSVAFFAVAVSAITFLAGLQNAVFTAMISPAAVLHARGEGGSLGQLVVTTTRYGMFLLLLAGLPLIFATHSLLSPWVGPLYAARAAFLLQVLSVATIIRLSATPYVMALIGTGQQRLVLISPLLEGASNLLVSVVAGYYYGAVGVALGTLVGGVIGVLAHYVYNMPRTTEIRFTLREYCRDGLLRPLVCAVPFVALAVVIPSVGGLARWSAVGIAFIATLLAIWRWGLVKGEREGLRLSLARPGGI